MAVSEEKKTVYVHPRLGKTHLTQDQYDRYEAAQESLSDAVSCFSLRRTRIVCWLGEFFNSVSPNSIAVISGERFETFLIAAEKITGLRKQNGSRKEIIDIAGEYLITHQMTWDVGSAWETGFVRYFIGQILWCFYEKYPKFIPFPGRGKHPYPHAVESMLSLPDLDIEQLTTVIGVLVPNVLSGGRYDTFTEWDDGKLMYLSRRVLNFPMDDDETNHKLLKQGRENGHTINLRLALAKHIDAQKRRHVLVNALEMAKAMYGDYHLITWYCTEKLGDYYLNHALQHTMDYYFSKLKGDKVKIVQGLYEEFLSRADEVRCNGGLKGADLEAVTRILEDNVVPALVKIYKQHGKEREARRLLWKFSRENSAQIYRDGWEPFTSLGKVTPLNTEIARAEDCFGYSNLKHSSLELVIFPFDEISLIPVMPSDEEKLKKWHFVFEKMPNGNPHYSQSCEWVPGLEGGYEAKAVSTRTTEKIDGDRITLELPYITYKHFKSSQVYRLGRTYDHYRKGSMDQPQLAEWRKRDDNKCDIFFEFGMYPEYIDIQETWPSVGGALVNSEKGEIEKFVYDRETGTLEMTDQGSSTKELENLLQAQILNVAQCDKTIPGFFNNTPGDTAAIDESRVAHGFNLVSADWLDWKQFILHPCASSERKPELVFQDGTMIPVLGYIYGSWTDQSLCKKWTGLQVWVVQARFELSKDAESLYPELSCHFLLNPDDLCKARVYELSPSEVRSVCRYLNPSLLRVMNHSQLQPIVCTFGQGLPDEFEGVTMTPDHNRKWDFVAELSHRDSWDTEFAHIYWETYGPARKKILKQQMMQETVRRKEWDQEYHRIVKQWLDSRA